MVDSVGASRAPPPELKTSASTITSVSTMTATKTTAGKVVRAQKIAFDGTITPKRSETDREHRLPREDERKAADRVAPAIPRSHTPVHLASQSQTRHRTPSELSLRQHSHSAAANPLVTTKSAEAEVHATFPVPPPRIPAPGAASVTVQSAAHATASSKDESAEARDRQSSPAAADTPAGSREGANLPTGGTIGRRPNAPGSTSAIATKQAAAASPGTGDRSVSLPHTSSVRGGRAALGPAVVDEHTPFPALVDPETARDVPVAPASGMYWSKAPVSGAPHTALRAHTTTLIGSNVYVFGGCDAHTCFNELYVLDADAFYWSKPRVVGEMPTPIRAMTCTAVGKKLVVFGGGDGPSYYNDVFVFDTLSYRWTKPRILGDMAPPKRRAHTACLYRNGIFVFGGGDGVRALNDIWRLDVSDFNKMSWKLISGPSSIVSASSALLDDSKPKARGYHTASIVSTKLIVYGGSDGGECFNDVWVYDVERRIWKPVVIPQAFRRLSHTATIVGSYLFAVGGHDGTEYSNDVLLLNLVTMTWDRRRVYGVPPEGRGYHGTVLHDSRLILIGGFDGNEVFSDVWILELAMHAYYSQISHFTIDV